MWERRTLNKKMSKEKFQCDWPRTFYVSYASYYFDHNNNYKYIIKKFSCFFLTASEPDGLSEMLFVGSFLLFSQHNPVHLFLLQRHRLVWSHPDHLKANQMAAFQDGSHSFQVWMQSGCLSNLGLRYRIFRFLHKSLKRKPRPDVPCCSPWIGAWTVFSHPQWDSIPKGVNMLSTTVQGTTDIW